MAIGCGVSIESKKSIKSAAGALGGCVVALEEDVCPASGKERPVAALVSLSLLEVTANGLLAPLFPPLVDSCSARYCLLLTSKSGSIK